MEVPLFRYRVYKSKALMPCLRFSSSNLFRSPRTGLKLILRVNNVRRLVREQEEQVRLLDEERVRAEQEVARQASSVIKYR